MSAITPEIDDLSGLVPLKDVERVLSAQLQLGQDPAAPAVRARMSNLIIYCNQPDQAERLAAVVPAVVQVHPARVLLLAHEPGEAPITATVQAWCRRAGGGQKICSEQVNLRAGGTAAERLPFAVRGLLVGDLPTNLWWATNAPPPLAGPLFHELTEHVQQLIYDSLGWADPHRGVAATGGWLAKFERGQGQGPWRVVSDLNWRRLKPWRRLLGQALDPAAAPGALDTIAEVLVEHGPHGVTQAWQLVGWLASRLGWRVETTRFKPGVEITWQVRGPGGPLRLSVVRLAEGKPEVRRVRFGCRLRGRPGAIDCRVVDDARLAATAEGGDATPLTLTVQPFDLDELVARQLSDRERDPVFRESMDVAHVFAQSLLS